ncbi:MAG: DUF2971 domain-containing protein [Bacteroides sp.]|nr:DUF2971 domain-containing protein [Bacteroides sp.]
MELLTPQQIEEIKKQKWFIMQHRDNCTICGKEFNKHENSYLGHLYDGSYAYTCEACSKKLVDASFYTNSQKKINRIPMPDAKLWRYMDLAKFLSLLESSSLFFTRLDHFEDPFEGSLGIQENEGIWVKKEKEWRKQWLGIEYKSKHENLNDHELETISERKIKEYRENIKNFRSSNYVSCWHQSDFESEAMWKLYTRDNKQGIAIQTTFESLYKSLLDSSLYSDFGMVNYVDYNEYNNVDSSKMFHFFEAPWYKRKSFEYEKEFRVIIEDNRKVPFRDWDKTIKVDLELLIENVYISPQADKWFADLVCDIIRNRYKLCLKVSQSDLNKMPFY